jgi:hypothetical protein
MLASLAHVSASFGGGGKGRPFSMAAFKNESGRANNHIEVSGAPVNLAPADAEGLSRWASMACVSSIARMPTLARPAQQPRKLLPPA